MSTKTFESKSTNEQAVSSETPIVDPRKRYEEDVDAILGLAEEAEGGLDNPDIAELMDESEERLRIALGSTGISTELVKPNTTSDEEDSHGISRKVIKLEPQRAPRQKPFGRTGKRGVALLGGSNQRRGYVGRTITN